MKVPVIPAPFQREDPRTKVLSEISSELTEECEGMNLTFELSNDSRFEKAMIVSAIIDKTNDSKDIGYFVLLSHLVKVLKQYKLLFLTVGYNHHPPGSNEFELNVPYERPSALALPLFDDPEAHLYNLMPIVNRVRALDKKSLPSQYLELTDKANKGFRILEKYVLPFFDYKDRPDTRSSSWKLVPCNAEQNSGGHQDGPLCSGELKRRNHIHYCVYDTSLFGTTLRWSQKPTCEVQFPDNTCAFFWVHDADPSYDTEAPRTRNLRKFDFRV